MQRSAKIPHTKWRFNPAEVSVSNDHGFFQICPWENFTVSHFRLFKQIISHAECRAPYNSVSFTLLCWYPPDSFLPIKLISNSQAKFAVSGGIKYQQLVKQLVRRWSPTPFYSQPYLRLLVIAERNIIEKCFYTHIFGCSSISSTGRINCLRVHQPTAEQSCTSNWRVRRGLMPSSSVKCSHQRRTGMSSIETPEKASLICLMTVDRRALEFFSERDVYVVFLPIVQAVFHSWLFCA